MESCKHLLISFLIASHAPAFGSPGGLQIVMVGPPKAAPHAAALDAFFKRYDVNSSGTDCDDSQLNIDSVYAHADKAGITPAMALGATNDIKQRRSLGKVMARFRDKNHERGFDGALAYDVQDDKILLYGISTMPSIKLHASVLPLADLRDAKKTSLAICHALVHLPVLAEP